MKRTFLLFIAVMFSVVALCNDPDTTAVSKEKIKTGWNFGGLPVVSYNTDLGFQYGALGQVFHYGDGSRYPDYFRAIKVEASTYTKGSSVFQLFYDDKASLPYGLRFTTDLSYLPSRADHFYGFNGAMTVFNSDFSNSKDTTNTDYISRMFYRQKRNLLRYTFDLQQSIGNSDFKWLAGIGVYWFQMGTVDIDRLNKKKDEDDPNRLPEVDLLYDNYVKWGIIDEEEADGGLHPFVKFGVIYDTRDIEANPNKGIWTELLFNIAPSFGAVSNHSSYGLVALTHRQYISLVPNRLIFAYRLGYQGTLFGTVPYYVQPFMISSFSAATTSDGLGGAKSLRGILKDRVVGSHIAFGSLELRWRFVNFTLGKQNIYLTLAPFVDAGSAVVQMKKDEIVNAKYQLSLSDDDPLKEEAFLGYSLEDYFTDAEHDKLHLGYGAGFYFSMNHNFVVAINYGRSAYKNDGLSGFYINIGFVF
ncbi:MAG: hypothetical protein PHR20_00880 [Bacteroidales bacterium]|nr:hypothetical protein [Bacteroidales bacterium]